MDVVDLALARAAVRACADAAMEGVDREDREAREDRADREEEAAAALIRVIAQTETTGRSAVNAVGEFMMCVWGRVVRYG